MSKKQTRRCSDQLEIFRIYFYDNTPVSFISQEVNELVDNHDQVEYLSVHYSGTSTTGSQRSAADDNEKCYYFLKELAKKTSPSSFPNASGIIFHDNGISITDAYGANLLFDFIEKLDEPCPITFQETKFSSDALKCLCDGEYDIMMSSSCGTNNNDNNNNDTNNVRIQDGADNVPQCYYFEFLFNDCVWVDEPCITISGGYDTEDYSTYVMIVTISKIRMDETEARRLIQALKILEDSCNMIIQTIQISNLSLSYEAFNYLQSQVHESKCSECENGPKIPYIEFNTCEIVKQQQDETTTHDDSLQQGYNKQDDNQIFDEIMQQNDQDEDSWSQNTISGSFSVKSKLRFFGYSIGTMTEARLLRPILEESIQSRQPELLYLYGISFSIETLQYFLSAILTNNSSDNRYMHVPVVQIFGCRLVEDSSDDDNGSITATDLPSFEWLSSNGRTMKIHSCCRHAKRSNLAWVKCITECSIFKSVEILDLFGFHICDVDFLDLSQILQTDQSTLTIKTLYMDGRDITDKSANHLATLLEARKNNSHSNLLSLLHVDIGLQTRISIVGAWRLVDALKVNYHVTMNYKTLNNVDNDDNDENNAGIHHDNISGKKTSFQLLQEYITFYSTLNKLGRAQLLLKTKNNQLTASLFVNVLENAKRNHSVVYWLLRTFPHVAFMRHQLVGRKRKA